MSAKDLGALEIQVLSFIVRAKEPQALYQIKAVLGKKENSAVTQPLNSLVSKQYLKVNEKSYKPKRGRPGSTYEPTEHGVRRHILEVKGNFGKELEHYKTMSNYMYDQYQIYQALEGYSRRDRFFKELNTLEIYPIIRNFSGEDVYAMGRALISRKLNRLPKKYKKRLQKIQLKTNSDLEKEVAKLVKSEKLGL